MIEALNLRSFLQQNISLTSNVRKQKKENIAVRCYDDISSHFFFYDFSLYTPMANDFFSLDINQIIVIIYFYLNY